MKAKKNGKTVMPAKFADPTPKNDRPDPIAKRAKAVKPETKYGKLRAYLAEHKKGTDEELMKASGFDSRNLKTALSILRNPKRTKELLLTDYDRKTKTYSVKGKKS